ncbi:MAG: hypothetical protein EPO21_15770 [Chloroflexota bacterium]|nr:MAG: hypothetical protein EPO21_15770 [Chloroflexota bacterium]
MAKIKVLNQEIGYYSQRDTDFICITGMARYKDEKRTDYIIQNWLRNRNTIEFVGLSEQLNNPGFNPIEFEGFRVQAGLNSFSLTAKRKKDIDALDIEIPVLTPRVYREYKNLGDLDTGALGHQPVAFWQFSEEEQREIVFKDITFNRIIGDSHFELLFARFLDDCDDVVSFAKNYLAVRFKLDYVNADGDISNYYPDFLVKLSGNRVFIVETKGQEDLDVPLKMRRLRQWCEDINRVQAEVKYDFVYVDEESLERYKPSSFGQLVDGFREYKE